MSFVSAVPSINIQKENYQSYETVIGRIDGTTGTILANDLKIYEDRREISFEKDVSTQFNGSVYFYFIPVKEGNFSVKIANVLFEENGTLNSVSLEKNVSVIDNRDNQSRREILTINPGFIVESKKFIYITNSGDKNVSANILNNTYDLIVGESKKINVSENNESFLEINSYENFSVPALYFYINKSTDLTINQTQANTSEEEINLSVVPEKIELKIIKNQSVNFSFQIINSGDKLGNITINTDDKIVSLENISEIEIGDTIISGSVLSNDEGFFYRNITLSKDGEEIARFGLEIYVFPDNETLAEVNVSIGKNCDYYNGTLCTTDQKCDGEFKYAGGLCCLTKCVDVNATTSSGSNVLIGLAIILFVGVLAYFIIKNAKKVRGTSVEDKFKKAEESYNKGTK